MEMVSGGGALGEADLRKGPWTAEEDRALANYIALYGDGRWNALARSAGLRRSGKSCRLRWLNYLRPDVRRGNFTPEEQLLILELHCRWGNRWSKIARHLPGRTDNEIKNYWRTRVQKHAKQLKCDVNSQRFRDAVRCLWMPHLLEKIQASSASSGAASSAAATYGGEASTAAVAVTVADTYLVEATGAVDPDRDREAAAVVKAQDNLSSGRSSTDGSASDSPAPSWSSSPPSSVLTDNFITQGSGGGGGCSSSSSRSDYCVDEFSCGQMTVDGASGFSETLLSSSGYLAQGPPEFEHTVWGLEDVLTAENWWAADDIWVSQDDIFAVLCQGENDDLGKERKLSSVEVATWQ